MKIRSLLSILFIAMLTFSGCGGGSSGDSGSSGTDDKKENKDNNSGVKNVTKLELDESYNNPKYKLRGNIIKIGSYYLNQYESVQEGLDKYRNEDKQKEFEQVLDEYASDLLLVTKAVDSIPSYAPRGELKGKEYDVVAGSVDYSDYKLKGDFDDNGLIDFKDIDKLKKAMFDNTEIIKYDVNGDNVLDVKDLLTLSSQLLTDISYFDFYKINGEKLDIPTRKYADDKIISYSGSEKKILVVAKDINKTSSYSDTLSDLSDVWYKKANPRSIKKNLDQSDANFNDKNNFIAQVNADLLTYSDLSEPYLVGYNFTAKISSLVDGFQTIDFSSSQSTISQIENKINSAFNTRLNLPFKMLKEPNKILFQIGKRDKSVKHNYVHALRKTVKIAKKNNGKTVYQRIIFHIDAVSYLSQKEETLKAKVVDPAGGDVKGTFVANRYGPLPKTDNIEKKGNGDFTISNAAWGGYDFSFKNECGCEVFISPPQGDFTQKDQKFNFDIPKMQKDINVKLIYKDKKGKPIKNKLIKVQETSKCRSKGHVPGTMQRKTDDNGVVEFTGNFTSGEFLIDGKKYNFCEDTTKDMDAKKLWDIKVDFESNYIDDSTYRMATETINTTFKDVEIFSKDDEPNVITPGSDITKPPKLPFRSAWRTNLGETEEDSNGNYLEIIYSNEGFSSPIGFGIEPNKYCIEINTLRASYSYCGKIEYYNGIKHFHSVLSDAQGKKLEDHKAFTFSDSGSTDLGLGIEDASLYMEFIPK